MGKEKYISVHNPTAEKVKVYTDKGYKVLSDNKDITVLEYVGTVKATYVSVWDNGDNVFESECDFNPETKEATNVESLDVDDVELFYVDKEFIRLADGTEIEDFVLDGIEYKNGQKED
jgi:predicted nucleic acid-binding protein